MALGDEGISFDAEIGGAVDIDHAPTDVNHCQAAIDRLIAQYRDKENIEAVLCLAGDRLNEIEQALTDVRAFAGIDNAFTHFLDRIGARIGLRREGLPDETYRTRLRARAYLVGASGHPEELMAALEILNGDAASSRFYEESYPAGLIMECFPLELLDGEAFARLLQQATPAAVRLVFFHHPPDVPLFGWDEDGTSDVFAEDDGGTSGGVWAEAT